jgi:hypothetical protein
MSRSPDAYESEDGLVASRIADQLALALAHQKLAEEELRKSRLAALDAMLSQLETLNDIDDIAVAVSRMARGILDHDAVGVLVSHTRAAATFTVFSMMINATLWTSVTTSLRPSCGMQPRRALS